MQLRDLIIHTRLRSAWSALDLGLLVAKQHWLLYVAVWLMLALPLFTVMTLIFDQAQLWIAITVIWWLKPLFERPIVYMLSYHVFDQSFSLKQVFFDYKKWLLPSLFWSLTLRRLSPSRSFLMPVILLERLKGSAYSKRVSTLSNKGGSQAFWLTTVFVYIEYFITFSLLILINNVFSIDFFEFFSGGELSLMLEMWANGVSLMTMAFVAPFFAASGFTLYLNRRVELEAWDIEICFREMNAEALR